MVAISHPWQALPRPQSTPRLRPLVLALELPGALGIVATRMPGASVILAGGAALGQSMLDEVQPDMVVCGLFGGKLDAVQVLARLAALRFDGALLVVTPPLPAADGVVDELREAAGGRSVTLWELPGWVQPGR